MAIIMVHKTLLWIFLVSFLAAIISVNSTVYPRTVTFYGKTDSGVVRIFNYLPTNNNATIALVNSHLSTRDNIVDFDVNDGEEFIWSEDNNNGTTSLFVNINRLNRGNTSNEMVTLPGVISSIVAYSPGKVIYFVEDYKRIRVIDYDGKNIPATLYELESLRYPMINTITNLFFDYHKGILNFVETIMDTSNGHLTYTLRNVPSIGKSDILISKGYSIPMPASGYNSEKNSTYYLSKQVSSLPNNMEALKSIIRDSNGFRNSYFIGNTFFYVPRDSQQLHAYFTEKTNNDAVLKSVTSNVTFSKLVPLYSHRWIGSSSMDLCLSKNCSHYCLLMSAESNYELANNEYKREIKCVCSDGYYMDKNGATCIQGSPMKSSQVKPDSDLIPLDWVLIAATTGIVAAIIFIIEFMIFMIYRCWVSKHRIQEDRFTRIMPTPRPDESSVNTTTRSSQPNTYSALFRKGNHSRDGGTDTYAEINSNASGLFSTRVQQQMGTFFKTFSKQQQESNEPIYDVAGEQIYENSELNGASNNGSNEEHVYQNNEAFFDNRDGIYVDSDTIYENVKQ